MLSGKVSCLNSSLCRLAVRYKQVEIKASLGAAISFFTALYNMQLTNISMLHPAEDQPLIASVFSKQRFSLIKKEVQPYFVAFHERSNTFDNA